MRKLLYLSPLLVLVGLMAAAAFSLWSYLDTPVAPPEETVVTFPRGTSLSGIASRLEDAGIISDALRFRLAAKLKGAERQVKAGEYEFSGPSRPEDILSRLLSGDVRRYRVTIPEGFTLREIEGALAKAGFAETERFHKLARDPDFVASLGIEASTLEGYVFPETYTFSAETTAPDLLKSMVAQFRLQFTPDLEEAAARHGLSVHQLVTLASIIQKEAGNDAEMPLISAAFHNRLKKKMRLQADPTVIYGIDDFDGNITRKHLETTTPYNTYRVGGLPPGPIASPGDEALRAAAFPAISEVLFFVSRGDGTHVFTTTLAEHNRAVRRFQLQRK